jgi:uncharacterized protein
MIEVVIDSIRVSLMSQHRVVVLKEQNSDRYLTIWIGPFEADAITVELQEVPPQRPLTHDLLKSMISELGGKVKHILINDMRDQVYYARVVIEHDGRLVEVDARPSDSLALAVRTKSPIYVAESVMESSGVRPDEDIDTEEAAPKPNEPRRSEGDERRLGAFADFINTLNIDDLEGNEDD